MARKSVSAPVPVAPLELVVSREDAAAKISVRVEKGNQLINQVIISWEQLKAIEKEYSKWSDYNTELLRQLFTNVSPSEEYATSYGVYVSNWPTLQDEIKDLHENLRDKIHRLESIKDRLELIPVVSSNTSFALPTKPIGKKVFLVHGRDEGAREATARFLEKLGLEAIILHEQANQGRTIIEKLEHNSDVDFAVILLTPDDVGAVANAADSLKPRARQNVILELGYFVGVLGRKNVCALYKGSLELPSDILGVVYVAIDDGISWKLLLAKELREAGFDVDLNAAM